MSCKLDFVCWISDVDNVFEDILDYEWSECLSRWRNGWVGCEMKYGYGYYGMIPGKEVMD
jgi:hypothetical protein